MESTKHTSPESGHYIVAIGASAGGLEAIHEFFDNMPSNGNFSFVIIQHLSADYKSLLVELIAKHTHMKVYEAEHGKKAEKNTVYVIPNNKLLTIKGGVLQLGVKNFEKAPNTAIDTFLHSLAQDQGSKAIAVILSGTGSDGSKGIQSVQDKGGMVLVQDPATAKFDGMPNSAINTGAADYILAPELMPEEIFNYIKERPVRVAMEGKPDESLLPEVLKLIEKSCQHDFNNYKTPTILRRIGRRMGLLGFNNFQDYLKLLRSSTEECRFLGKEFLIGVTKFFRDRAAFQIMREEVLPDLIARKEDNEILKVWVTACSTGEEAYSIAIMIDDLLQSLGRTLEVKIFATDIDNDSIEFASRGIYPAQSLAELEDNLVSRYFIREGSHLHVHPNLRRQIVFARHNILKDPPFIKNDVVTCRNMLIYMNHILQRKVLSTLQFSLNIGGCLFLGPSEIPASVKDGFEEINGKWKVFRKINGNTHYSPERFPSAQAYKTQKEGRSPAQVKEDITIKALADDFRTVLVEEYGFAAIYIDKNYEIREAIGDFRKYLSLPDRIVALNLLKMVSNELSVALNTAIRKALKDNVKVSLNHVRIRRDDGDKMVNLFVRPTKENYIMIVLGESAEIVQAKPFAEYVHDHSLTGESASYVAELEEELKDTRTSLQLAVESLETANEELQSSNEELLSANEELQSSNEELQSLNEELHTLNTEHQLRIKELIELNDDLNNYFRSTEIAQVFVDRDLRIRKFNPVAVRMINLIESDIGRPIEHISTNLRDARGFVEDISAVLSNRGVVEKEIVLTNGIAHLMKIIPYIRQDGGVDGAVITFIDISNIKELDSIIKSVFDASLSAIMAFKAVRNSDKQITDFRWIASNYAADNLLQKSKHEYIGKSLRQHFPGLLKANFFESCIQVTETGKPLHTEMQLDTVNGVEWFEIATSQMMDGLVINLTNINEKKKAEEKFRRNYHELMKAKENYRNLNIALEEKVTERTQELTQSEERFRLIANTTSDAIWDWDLVNNNIWWSESFFNRFGHKKDPSTFKSDFWLKQIHSDDRARVTRSIHEAINRGEGSWQERYRFAKADGSYALISDKGAVLTDSEGTPYRMVGAMMDITEAEATEQKIHEKNQELELLFQEFKFVTDFMPQMVWSTQPDGYHDFYNKGWFDFTGMTFEETKDKGWANLLHPDDFERTWKIWKESLDTGRVYETEYRMRRYDGVYRWFLARALPMRNEFGEIVKWFGTCTDIHDQKMVSDILEQKVKERTEELEKINLELEASNNELLQFASVASHDLKEPLRKIHMFGNLIKDRYLSDGANGALDYMNRIIAASARMTKLINDLLTFTRLSIATAFESTDLNTIVSEVLSDLELVINEKEAVIEVDELPRADIITGQMRQVFQNLISNSLKFTKPGVKPKVRISCQLVEDCSFDARASKKGAYCRLAFSDNGIGFDNQYADKIFTIFQRLHAREKYDGTGIGLAITRKIIEKHNGVIKAESEEGKGSIFTIIIPLEQVDEDRLDEKPEHQGAKISVK